MPRQIDAVVLAGGKARRMDGDDKGLVLLAGQPLIVHTLNRLKNQVTRILINANRNGDRYAEFGHQVISDGNLDFAGPLAGILSALHHTSAELLLVVPCDCPQLPEDLLPRLLAGLEQENAELAIACDAQRSHPVVMLLRTELKQAIADYLSTGERRVEHWCQSRKLAKVSFADKPGAFTNLNTKDELTQWEQTNH
ncbi:molybdenum cofactor guanylyltransferase MobA [Shewanella sedimentimangrovi]|uniref:Molybdenum cofactor guanylyltransferase n=1 Tax=Shewanella sedimentimangrovi TaxID=2814293 RepID=A0ABX7R2U2_9GAMM|nr:molybdenum cofactor guanylyltransferase MobA [Shewanella sedimentimangrovi]QSX37393.1 molybdenum cofactor guanylyltransferase MobA [Shewanella sedimentimangrovi]